MLEINHMKHNMQKHFLTAAQFRECKQYSEAIQHCKKALQIDPNHIEIISLLGECLVLTGETDQAQKCFFKLIQLQPDNYDAHARLSQLFWARDSFDLAIHHGIRALPAYQNNADFLYYLGFVFQRLQIYQESIKYYEQSIVHNPDNALTWNKLGMVHILAGNLTRAEKVYGEALLRYPEWPSLLLNLGRCLDEQGRSHQALEYYSKVFHLTQQESQPRSNLLFALHYQPCLTPEYLFRAHIEWSNRPPKKYQINNTQTPIRVGYVSSDFRMHPVSAFIFPVLQHHNPDLLQVYCYSNVLDPDGVTQKIKQLPIQWRDISRETDEAVYHMIQKDNIDILVDLGGHSENNRLSLFAMKPSPIQISYLGYPGTTGLKTIDYRITDRTADPPGNEAFHTEKLLYMPNCFLCYHTLSKFPSVNELPAMINKYITFGSFNRLPKINPPLLKMWGQILQQISNSHMVLKSIAFQDRVVKDRIYAFFESMGINRDRIHLLDLAPSIREHLQSYHQIDIALDTYPYNGTTTTCESLMMGVPVITLEGKAHVSRVSSSILYNTGLRECIAHSPEAYIQKAVQLAQNSGLLAKLRLCLRKMFTASPLYQWQDFVEALEERYHRLQGMSSMS
jgi:predicted O-linked N-acetylglucosamine transferase (SPINDLY family)